MTPFGLKMRDLRAERGLTQQQQADYLGVSKAYISALETGSRGRPSGPFVDQICAWLGLIWDDAEVLKIWHPCPIQNRRSTPANVVLLLYIWQICLLRTFTGSTLINVER